MKPIYAVRPTLRIQPALELPSKKELDRRKAVVDRILKRRAEMAPIDIIAADLVKERRRETTHETNSSQDRRQHPGQS